MKTLKEVYKTIEGAQKRRAFEAAMNASAVVRGNERTYRFEIARYIDGELDYDAFKSENFARYTWRIERHIP